MMATDEALLDSTKMQDEVFVQRENGIKIEVKPEPVETVCCTVCGARAAVADCSDITTTITTCGTALQRFLHKFTQCDLATAGSRHVCRTCFDLINVLEQAELEYLKLKETFEAILSKNPLFSLSIVQSEPTQTISVIKIEAQDYQKSSDGSDSENVPLAVAKKKRGRPRKRKVYSNRKKPLRKRPSNRTGWECGECGARGDKGGAAALTAHRLAKHPPEPEPAQDAVIANVKKEDSVDSSENSHFNNGVESVCKEETDNFDDDDDELEDEFDSMFVPAPPRRKRGAGRPRKNAAPRPTKKGGKVLHQCTECDAKYTSLRRLEAHIEKHTGGKPPYICEVCGARYKHKRACDIHVALHKGISDWKCEECNKLFPSKGALQRHNNIHTGKLNYQCDLCGKSFIHTSSFKMHKLSHSGVKPHSCDVCGLALMTRSHLKRHKRVHSGEKRHECTICGKRFSERYNLAAHAKSHEGTGEVVPQLPRRRLFRCPYCQDRFERRYMLERHVSVIHGRTLERVPPTPRNTMSKLLKAQAQARQQAGGAGAAPTTPADPRDVATPHSDVVDPKEERSPEPRPAITLAVLPHKLQLASTTTTISAGSWSGAYAAEFGIRQDFPN